MSARSVLLFFLGLGLAGSVVAQNLNCSKETTPECLEWNAKTMAQAQREQAASATWEAVAEVLVKVYSEDYVKCMEKSIASLDDGVSDAGTIAVGAHAACRKQFDMLYKVAPAAEVERTEVATRSDAVEAVLRNRAAKKKSRQPSPKKPTT